MRRRRRFIQFTGLNSAISDLGLYRIVSV